MALPKMYIKKIKNKKICFGNCGNAIAENVKNIYIYIYWQLWQCHCRKRKKKIVLAIVTMPLPKMEKKNYEICERVKKKICHVHNILTINYTWLIIISSKNLWQINCGNGIAEIREKNQVQLTRCKLNYNILILKWCKQKQKKSLVRYVLLW